jgi:hypothetical protein
VVQLVPALDAEEWYLSDRVTTLAFAILVTPAPAGTYGRPDGWPPGYAREPRGGG